MQHPVVSLQNVSVKYRSPEEPFGSFKDFAIRSLRGQMRMHDFWALQDVDLEILSGETFGIIGRNGAGKTTLLKVISRVLAPSNGRLVIDGLVAPLLEFGAGFQPELTGRENVYLNGALLGHSRRDINDHLPEILDFAELNGFIDAPIRKYSSGMIARLGFSIATSWKPEILILDEVFAVGDESFKAKCFARINNFRTNGSTIILVTHNMSMMIANCDRAAWLDRGRLQAVGESREVAADYLNTVQQQPALETGR